MKLKPKLRRRGLLALVVAVLAFTGVSAVAAWWLTAPVRHTIGAVPADFGWPVEPIHFPAREDEVSLAGWFVPCPGAKQAVVLLHGYQADRRKMLTRAAWLRGQGYAVLLYDARACGESGGDKISAGWFETHDLLGALDFLRGRGFSEFGCIGISQGGATIALAAARLAGVRWAVLDDRSVCRMAAGRGCGQGQPARRGRWVSLPSAGHGW
jgi:pimeloyl-ACP methyl ester carboxylesterase